VEKGQPRRDGIEEQGEVEKQYPRLCQKPLHQGERSHLIGLEDPRQEVGKQHGKTGGQGQRDPREFRDAQETFPCRSLNKDNIVKEDRDRKHRRVLFRSESQKGRCRAAAGESPASASCLGRSRPDEEVQGHDVTEAGHGGHPLDNDRHGVDLQGIDRPQESREKRDVVSPVTVPAVKERQLQGPEHKEEQKNGATEVDEKVHDVVAKDIRPPKEIVQPEGQVGQGPGQMPAPGFHRCPVEAPVNVVPGKGLEMNIAVVDDVVIIVEMPLAEKAVSVNDQQHGQQGDHGERNAAGLVC